MKMTMTKDMKTMMSMTGVVDTMTTDEQKELQY